MQTETHKAQANDHSNEKNEIEGARVIGAHQEKSWKERQSSRS